MKQEFDDFKQRIGSFLTRVDELAVQAGSMCITQSTESTSNAGVHYVDCTDTSS